MEQPDFFPIPSPCIGVCEANAKGYCKGCLRPTAHHNKEKHEKTACLPACAIDCPRPGRL